MTEEDPKQEHSDFAGEFTDDGVTVLVDIFRPAGSTGGWSLEVIDQDEDEIQRRIARSRRRERPPSSG